MAVSKKNIFLTQTVEAMPYMSLPSRGSSKFPNRDVNFHANRIQTKLNECYGEALTQKQVAAIKYKDGTYLEFSGAAEYELAVKSLENRQQGIHLLNVRQDEETNTVKATVYIPAGKESYFIKKIEDYADETKNIKSGNPKNNNLIGSIDDIKLALLDSFWIGKPEHMPDKTAVWCEIWLRYDYKVNHNESWNVSEENFNEVCSEENIQVDSKRIIFPERIVKLAKVTSEQLKIIISKCPYIAEIRRAQEATAFFDELNNSEQREWVEDLLSRTIYSKDGVAVCLLDTGVSTAHPLISPAVDAQHIQAVDASWGTGDHQGHGTEMAGLVLYNDLKQALISQKSIQIPYELESVKLLPPRGANEPELYGALTEQAVSLAEIANPPAQRVICMAITSPEINTFDGSPTSWSAAIDSITSGANEDNEKRLFLISAGNVQPNELTTLSYPDANTLHCVESPGQSWNAITVGAFSKDVNIVSDEFQGFSPVAAVGGLSPYSSTSETWSSKWPIKPEVLFDGGNVATNGTDYFECPDLSILTTNYRPLVKQFSTIWATSSATAQAAWFCAQVMSEYPEIWPETVRALLVHSASWTDEMKRQFCTEDTKTKGRRRLLRACGYGIPNLEKAIQCMNNSVNMIIQGELQPYNGKSMNEMHVHALPWPKEVLESLGEENVTMKVTLSYFIEPGPGEVGWKDKYRYPSCGLRFDVINSNESPTDFKKRVNVKMRGDDKKDSGDGTSGSERWYLGADNRDVGSIHSDFCELSAVELSECNQIAVYPVIGWWRERSYLGKSNNKIRYSLIVSLSTPKQDVDLYTPIITQIANATEIEI